MHENSSVFQHLKHPARCVEAQLAEEERHRFYVGTYSARGDNELHLIEFVEQTNEITVPNIFSHPNEIIQIAPCPASGCSPLLFTCHRGGFMNTHFQSSLLQKRHELRMQNQSTQQQQQQQQDTNTTTKDTTSTTTTTTNSKNSELSSSSVHAHSRQQQRNRRGSDSGNDNNNNNNNNNNNKETIVLTEEDKQEQAKIFERLVDHPTLHRATLWQLVDLDREDILTYDVSTFVVTKNGSKHPSMVLDNLQLASDDINEMFENDMKIQVDMPIINTQPTNISLEPMLTLPNTFQQNNKIQLSHEKVLWSPTCSKEQFMTLDSKGCLQYWKFQSNFSGVKEVSGIYDPTLLKDLSCGCWNPHYPDRFITGNDRSLRMWDVSVGCKPTETIENAHSNSILAIDHNPNKPYHIISSAKDNTVKFWDLRNTKKPLKILCNHSHWIWSCRYNRFHDQLIISSGSDALVSLWNIVSVSSAPLGELEDNMNVPPDALVRKYQEHEESVYSTAWSANNAWVFASLSFDGRLVINHVPSNTKYQILL